MKSRTGLFQPLPLDADRILVFRSQSLAELLELSPCFVAPRLIALGQGTPLAFRGCTFLRERSTDLVQLDLTQFEGVLRTSDASEPSELAAYGLLVSLALGEQLLAQRPLTCLGIPERSAGRRRVLLPCRLRLLEKIVGPRTAGVRGVVGRGFVGAVRLARGRV